MNKEALDKKIERESKLLKELKAFAINLNSGWYPARIEMINKLREIILKNE